MSVNTVNSDGSLLRVAGGILYADNPIGTILPYGGTEAPKGWMLCQGQAVSRTDYADLFAVIGTSFGTGDGSTTFNLPDLRGEFLRGAGTNSHTNQGNGGTVGEHQNATEIPYVWEKSDGSLSAPHLSSGNNLAQNPDARSVKSEKISYSSPGSDVTYTDGMARYSARPTNTSVNYIIKVMQVAVPTDIEAGVQSIISVSEMPMDVDPTSAEIDSYPVGAMWLETDD